MNEELIDLSKKVQVVLDLRKIDNVKAQVCLAIDGSGSMQGLYSNGTVQKTVDRISAVAVKFDDNQELDVMCFSNGVNEAKSATTEMFGSYVRNELLNKGKVEFGGTNYVPFINQVVENYFSKNVVAKMGGSILGALKSIFGSKPAQTPVSSTKSDSGFPIYCIVITDGENFDKTETKQLLEHMKDKDIFWNFVGVGSEHFTFLKELAKDLPNVGFFSIDNLGTVKDMDLYKNLISEKVATWFKKF